MKPPILQNIFKKKVKLQQKWSLKTSQFYRQHATTAHHGGFCTTWLHSNVFNIKKKRSARLNSPVQTFPLQLKVGLWWRLQSGNNFTHLKGEKSPHLTPRHCCYGGINCILSVSAVFFPWPVHENLFLSWSPPRFTNQILLSVTHAALLMLMSCLNLSKARIWSSPCYVVGCLGICLL